MEVLHALGGVLAGVHHEAVAVLEALDLSHLAHGAKDMTQRLLGHVVADVGVVVLGDNEGVNRHEGLEVIERDDVIVLVDLFGRDLAGSDLAEDAVLVLHEHSLGQFRNELFARHSLTRPGMCKNDRITHRTRQA